VSRCALIVNESRSLLRAAETQVASLALHLSEVDGQTSCAIPQKRALSTSGAAWTLAECSEAVVAGLIPLVGRHQGMINPRRRSARCGSQHAMHDSTAVNTRQGTRRPRW